jgi:MFS family permease
MRRRAELAPAPALPPSELLGASPLVWKLGLGAFGLAWSITTVAAYLPPLLERFTSSGTLIGLVLALEGVFALTVPLLVGPMSDATTTSFGRRRPYLLLAVFPMAAALAVVAFMPGLLATAAVLCAFFFAYNIYEPPYRGLYPDCLPEGLFGRSQGVQHLYRGAALGGALVGGGFLFAVWHPFPFLVAAGVTALACGAVVVLVQEPPILEREHERLRTYLAAPWRIVRRDATVRRFLICNTAWEATFAGMRTFVVLYVIQGLDEPLYVSSVLLAVVAAGYVAAALFATRFGDRFGIGNVILGASVVYGCGLLFGGFPQQWHWWYLGVVAPVAFAAGIVMTLAWALLFTLMPRTERGAVTGLATTTRGLGLLIGPLAVGAAIDIFRPFLEETDGYAAVWPAVAIPVLAVIPIVTLLADEENRRRGIRGRGSRRGG